MRLPKTAIMRFFYLGLILAAVPCIAYLWARYDGSLPLQEEWLRSDHNHGPWHYSLAGYLFYVPFLGPMLTFGFALDRLTRGKFGPFCKAFALMLGQIMIAFLPLLACFWVLD